MNRPYKTKVRPSSTADILAEVRISDAPEIMRLHELAPEIQADIARARDAGFNPVSLRWPTGQLALMFCEPGSEWPSPEKVITAYRRCLTTNEVFPNGVPS